MAARLMGGWEGIYGASHGAMGTQRSDSTSIIPGGGAMGEGYGAAVGLRGFYGAGVKTVSRDPLKSMGRPDGCTAAGGLGGSMGLGWLL